MSIACVLSAGPLGDPREHIVALFRQDLQKCREVYAFYPVQSALKEAREVQFGTSPTRFSVTLWHR